MINRQYPCIIVTQVDEYYSARFYMNKVDYFVISCSFNHKHLANQSLKDSFDVKVPFYDEVNS